MQQNRGDNVRRYWVFCIFLVLLYKRIMFSMKKTSLHKKMVIVEGELFFFYKWFAQLYKTYKRYRKQKLQKNTVPKSTKPCQYSFWPRLKVNEKKMKKKKSVRGECDFLMLLQTMANKWYKRLQKISTKSFWF